ncbi:MAG TPA: class I SAM-dependent methyltransferase [Kofleriaceae bacterium]
MSKRDDDPTSDMEVGMTTAERRRRRRRGGGLRVPSDNVPRRTTPPVVAPVPEDPSLAMSIAYSFGSEASQPVPRVDDGFDAPMAPEAMTTVIDPPSAPIEAADFEAKTREMAAVDLEALGLTDPSFANQSQSSIYAGGATTIPVSRVSEPSIEVNWEQAGTTHPGGKTNPGLAGNGEVSVTFRSPTAPPATPVGPVSTSSDLSDGWSDDSQPDAGVTLQKLRASDVAAAEAESAAAELASTIPDVVAPAPSGPIARPKPERPRLQTVALSEADLEEVREAARAATAEAAAPAAPAPPPIPPAAATTQPGVRAHSSSQPPPMPPEPMSVPDIELMSLDSSAESTSGEFEVDMEDGVVSAADAGATEAKVADPIAPAAAISQPGIAVPPERRARPPSIPPTNVTAPPAPHKAPPAPPPKKAPPPPAKDALKDNGAKDSKEQKALRGKPWFVDLFDEDYLRTLPFLTPQATQAEAEFVIDALGLQPGGQVLDIGCGYGRHAMELAARGFHVVGLDLSTPLLVRGGEEAHRRGLTINFVRGDMRELDFEAQFDGAYCLFSTFGYFDDETNKRTVSNIARALKPGGRVLIEILNRDYVIQDLPTRVWWEGEGCVVLEEVELNYFSSRIQVNRSVVFDDGRQLEQEISVRAYSLHEVGKLMHAAGFRVLEVSGAFHTRGRFFGNQSRHIIVLAERKDASS